MRIASLIGVFIGIAWLVAGCSADVRLCNGRAELCERPFDQVAFAGSHNSMANAAEDWFAPNQSRSIEDQLADGIRVMLLDTYDWNGELQLCHGVCELGARPLIEALAAIRTFLDRHPDEVFSIIFQDNISAADTERAFDESGLLDLAYAHPAGEPWPSLGALIDADTRVLVTAEHGRPPPAWYHHVWDLSFDTRYSFAELSEMDCVANRGDAANDLFLLNHWISNPLPSPSAAEEANTYEVLMDRAAGCAELHGRIPNFVAVDFQSTGDLLRVVDKLNGF